MDTKNISGPRIKEARVEKKMLQVDVVAILNVDFGIKLDSSAFGRIERCQRSVNDYELLALSKILEVPLDYLLQGVDLLS